ncbi:MAG TPA: methyltransferase domain-containing protein [Steroidobacteraceae bacterium]|nr:methyltransferase domain-containing protein [Steroidobacteraceae bacterium]
MMNEASGLTHLASRILACPACRTPLEPAQLAQGASCRGCGRRYPFSGTALDFLGARAEFSLSDLQLARRVFEQRQQLTELWTALQSLPDHGRRELFGRLGATLGLRDAAEGERFLHALPAGQVINDLAHYDGRGAVGPTPGLDFLQQNLRRSASATILDAGCSVGRQLLSVAQPGAELVGIDVSLLSLSIGSEAWSRTQAIAAPLWCNASVLNLPFRDASFTHALSFVVLGLVPLRTALRELSRVLVPGGQLIFTVEGTGYWWKLWRVAPTLGRERIGLLRWWLGRQLLRTGVQWRELGGLRRLAGLTQYSPGMLRHALSSAGFAVERIDSLADYHGRPLLLGVSAVKSPHSPGAPG